jgi:hypothetical protein
VSGLRDDLRGKMTEKWQNWVSENRIEIGVAKTCKENLNPSIEIGFQLKEDGMVELTVYNLKGQQVKRLVEENMSAGIHLYQQKAGEKVQTKRMILIK